MEVFCSHTRQASTPRGVAHGSFSDPPGSALLPITNGGELAVLYCFVFLYIAARGAGIWSVDSARGAAG